MTNTKALDEAVRRIAPNLAESYRLNLCDPTYITPITIYQIRAEYRRIVAKGERQ